MLLCIYGFSYNLNAAVADVTLWNKTNYDLIIQPNYESSDGTLIPGTERPLAPKTAGLTSKTQFLSQLSNDELGQLNLVSITITLYGSLNETTLKLTIPAPKRNIINIYTKFPDTFYAQDLNKAFTIQ